jgi:hypothetical protein
MEDVDGDGEMDLLFHFKTQELKPVCGQHKATLTSETRDGVRIKGTATVNVVPRDKGK